MASRFKNKIRQIVYKPKLKPSGIDEFSDYLSEISGEIDETFNFIKKNEQSKDDKKI